MKTIWKFPLLYTDIQSVSMPLGAQVLSTGLDPQGQLCLWALVDPGAGSNQYRGVAVIGTGNPAHSAQGMRFVGTVVQAPFVWHVFVTE